MLRQEELTYLANCAVNEVVDLISLNLWASLPVLPPVVAQTCTSWEKPLGLAVSLLLAARKPPPEAAVVLP